ncbi:HAD family phosphatase [Microbacterium sp. ARD32]|uniref:HAD family hydrolase n=1 Tax=Microbacterium sp. ARD32 TaxID=2962577 RepID=UPI0028818069|nr:HAD family phosphatase [Microbacterium sp. ARD32]MDT0157129.1 HAD family phosphatase [Microbacterium sp. ARD32]
MSSKPRAVLWDMDGTLVDTEPYWMAAETELVESYGGTWSHEQALGLIGNGLLESAVLFQGLGVDLDAQAIVDRLTDSVAASLRSRGVPFRPGARELLRDLRDAGITTALVTMSLRRMAADVVDLIDFEAFDLVVAGEDAVRPKPFPDPYLRAAELLGVDIADTVAIEDSRTGVTSAVASGAVTVGVPNLIALDGLGAHELWPTLSGRTAADVVALHARHAEESAR